MSDLEDELLGLAENDPHHSKKRGKQKSQAFMEDSDDNEEDMDMDMDLDSDEDEPRRGSGFGSSRSSGDPYPLEGKYKNEEDRDYLESLPEIEKEQILATRQEEIQKYKDSMQLDAMYKMAQMEGDESDDGHAKKRRKHTSVTTEASRAMAELKNRRKQKDERAQRRAERRLRHPGSMSPARHDDVSSEEGEISTRDDWRAASPSTRPERREKGGVNLDAIPANYQELNSARLSRYELVDLMYKDEFEKVITGAYVRLMAGETDDSGRPKYRAHKIVSIDSSGSHGRYSIEYKGKQVSDTRALVCSYGKVQRLYRIADVSNSEFDESEFSRFMLVCQGDGVAPPRRSELKHKHDQISKLRDRPMTEDEINRHIQARQQSKPTAHRTKIVLQVTSLMASKQLALRRNDLGAVELLNEQIRDLGADPTTGELEEGGDELNENDLRIQRINENNRRKTKESMARAHEAALARKKAEGAVLKAKAAAIALADHVAAEAPPVSGLKRGETPQQYVARTITLDLGDF